jgi:hypothetical protein
MSIIVDIYDKLLICCEQFSNNFTTADVIEVFRQRHPKDWDLLQQMYGKGGKGNGNNYSPYVYIGQMLGRMSRRKIIVFRSWAKAPEGWGNGVIMEFSPH